MANRKQQKRDKRPIVPINEDSEEREPIPSRDDKMTKEKKSYADDMRVVSALSSVLGGTFFGIFNSFMNHTIPSLPSGNCIKKPENTVDLKVPYVVLATIGFMTLFSAALVSYEFFLLFRDKKISDPKQQWKYLQWCYALAFVGIVLCFAAHSVSLYIVQCDKIHLILLSYVIPLSVIFLATVAAIGLINYTFTRER